MIINQVVSGGGSAPALYRAFELDQTGKLIASTTESQIMDFIGMTDVYDYILADAYRDNTVISGVVDMSDLTTISGGNACYCMFFGCTGLTSVNMGSLTTLSGSNACNSMFYGCTGITSVDLSSLTTISGTNTCNYMFHSCTGLTILDLSSLTTISGGSCNSMFFGCTGLTSADMSALTTLTGNAACNYMFSGCSSLTTVRIGNTIAIDFGTRTNQFNNMFAGCTQNIDVYAPAANQTQIDAMSGYPNFGGTGTVTWHWNTAE